MKASGYGQGNIRQYIDQLAFPDVTANHMAEAGIFITLMNRILGTEDVARGDLSQLPERPGMLGIQAATSGAMSRLQHQALMISMMAMDDIGWQFAWNTLQFMGKDVGVSILGRYQKELQKEYGLGEEDEFITVGKFDLPLNFELEPFDGASSKKNIAAMGQFVQWGLQTPQGQAALGDFDFGRALLQFLRESGFENVHDFIRRGGQVQPMPDEQVAQQVQAGNLAPIGAVQ